MFSELLHFQEQPFAKKDINDIIKTAKNYLEDELLTAKTFKVEAKRSDKKFHS